MVTIGDDQTSLMGLMTRDDFSDLPEGIGDDETVAVYLPMSYQLGGFTVMVPKSKVRPVDMKVDQAMLVRPDGRRLGRAQRPTGGRSILLRIAKSRRVMKSPYGE